MVAPYFDIVLIFSGLLGLLVCYGMANKVNKELIKSDPHQFLTLNIKGKDIQIQLKIHKNSRWQAQMAALFTK